MGGSGSGKFFDRSTTPEKLREAIRSEEERAKDQEFETSVSAEIGKLLEVFNDRDERAVAESLKQIVAALSDEIEGDLQTVFGGSVRKHTYVDGISDVDALVILRDPTLRAKTPSEVLEYFENQLR